MFDFDLDPFDIYCIVVMFVSALSLMVYVQLNKQMLKRKKLYNDFSDKFLLYFTILGVSFALPLVLPFISAFGAFYLLSLGIAKVVRPLIPIKDEDR